MDDVMATALAFVAAVVVAAAAGAAVVGWALRRRYGAVVAELEDQLDAAGVELRGAADMADRYRRAEEWALYKVAEVADARDEARVRALLANLRAIGAYGERDRARANVELVLRYYGAAVARADAAEQAEVDRALLGSRPASAEEASVLAENMAELEAVYRRVWPRGGAS